MVSQDIAVHRRRQQVLPVPDASCSPQLRGGNVDDARDRQGKDPGVRVETVQLVPLGGKLRFHVRLCPAESGDPRKGRDLLRLMPRFKAEEHIRPHQQPQFILRELRFQLRQRVGGKALSRPAHLHIQRFHLAPKAQLLPRHAGHFQPLLRRGAACGQVLVGRDAGGDQQQLVQLQRGDHGAAAAVRCPRWGGLKVPP